MIFIPVQFPHGQQMEGILRNSMLLPPPLSGPFIHLQTLFTDADAGNPVNSAARPQMKVFCPPKILPVDGYQRVGVAGHQRLRRVEQPVYNRRSLIKMESVGSIDYFQFSPEHPAQHPPQKTANWRMTVHCRNMLSLYQILQFFYRPRMKANSEWRSGNLNRNSRYAEGIQFFLPHTVNRSGKISGIKNPIAHLFQQPYILKFKLRNKSAGLC